MNTLSRIENGINPAEIKSCMDNKTFPSKFSDKKTN